MYMAASFYFYDLETSGFNPREARIMQFAGQRTDMNLEPLGEPHNILIKMTDDVVPEPDAVLITGITPQQTLADGITEAAFLRLFEAQIAVPGTIFVGFNTVRFDDEFMRYLHYRNFYDPYEWQWKDGRARWDVLDVVRMTRALRPDGIEWPFAPDGSPTNRLELLTAVNKLDHFSAHDALSDVQATIAVARLIQQKQPALFEYLLKMRDKKEVKKLVEAGQPFVYSSGKYPGEFQKTTVATFLGTPQNTQGALVYDLRYDPQRFVEMTVDGLVEAWQYQKEPNPASPRLPVKLMQYNRCPAVAPLGVLDEAAQHRIGLKIPVVTSHVAVLRKHPDFAEKVSVAFEQMRTARQTRLIPDDLDVDTQLYDGFFADIDKTKMRVVRAAEPDELATLDISFKDERLRSLLPLYKARNYAATMTDEERVIWEQYRERKLLGGKQASRLARYFDRLAELANNPGLSAEKQYLLEELQLYGQSIMPLAEG